MLESFSCVQLGCTTFASMSNDTVDLEACNTDDEQLEGAFMEADDNVVSIPGNSIMRDLVLEEIASRALVHPSHKIRRNRDNND
jgi:hypothetical protein